MVALFGLRGIQHTPISIKNARVSQVFLGKGRRGRHLVLPPASDLTCPIPHPALQGQPHCHFQLVSGEYHRYNPWVSGEKLFYENSSLTRPCTSDLKDREGSA